MTESTSSENKNPVEENTGFAGIGKRIEDLESSDSFEDVNAWKQIAEERVQKKSESIDNETLQETYTSKSEKNTVPFFRLSFAKIFWGIIGLIVVISMCSENSNKKTSDYKVSDSPTQQYSSPTPKDDSISVGQYRCSQYHHNRAQELKPSNYEMQSIEDEQRSLSSLKMEIETDYVDQYSQSSIDRHNMLIDDYNSRLRRIRRVIDNYNNKLNAYNNYLMNNCSRAY